MKEDKIKEKISKLEKRIKTIEIERTKNRKNAEYNNRELRKSAEDNDIKKYERLFVKEGFYRNQMEELDRKVNEYRSEIRRLDKQFIEEKYVDKLKAFDELMVKHLTNLVENLDNILEGKSFDPTITDKIYADYTANTRGITKDHLWVYENFGMDTLKKRYSYIMEWVAVIARKDVKVQPALKITKVDTFTNLMKRLAVSCIAEVEKRNSPKGLTEKLVGAFKNGVI